MAHVQDFGKGREERVIVTRETVNQFDNLTLVTKPTTSDTLSAEQRHIKFEGGFEQDQVVRTDKRTTRDHLSLITRMLKASWSMDMYAIPFTGNLATNIYNCGPLLKMAFGNQTPGVLPSRVDWTLSDAQSGLDVATIHRKLGDVYMEAFKSAWVDEFKVEAKGGDEPKFMFSGGAQNVVTTGFGRVNGAHLAGDMTIAIQTDSVDESVYSFENGSIVQFGADNNGGAGFQVTSGGGTSILTIPAPGLLLGLSDGDVILPFLPSGSTFPDECTPPSAQPLAGILGTLNIAVADPVAGYDETAVPIVSFSMTLKNNIKPIDTEAFRSTVRDAIPGYRDVTGEISIILTREQVKRLGHRKNSNFARNAITVSLGGALGAAGTFTISMPSCQMLFSNIEVPEADESTFTLPYRAFGVTGGDSITLTAY